MLVTELGIVVFSQPFIKVFVAVSMRALQLSRESYVVLPASTLIDVSPEQPLNAKLPMLVTELPIVIDVRPEQPMNAYSPILITELGMVIEVRPVQ